MSIFFGLPSPGSAPSSLWSLYFGSKRYELGVLADVADLDGDVRDLAEADAPQAALLSSRRSAAGSR